MKNKIFLGGACNKPDYRDILMPELEEHGIDYFNPVVKDWAKEGVREEEERQKSECCNIHLYVVTPKMTGVYSIAEFMSSSFNQNKLCIVSLLEGSYIFEVGKTIHGYDFGHFDESQRNSLYRSFELAREESARDTSDNLTDFIYFKDIVEYIENIDDTFFTIGNLWFKRKRKR